MTPIIGPIGVEWSCLTAIDMVSCLQTMWVLAQVWGQSNQILTHPSSKCIIWLGSGGQLKCLGTPWHQSLVPLMWYEAVWQQQIWCHIYKQCEFWLTLYPAVKIKTPNLPIITKLREFLSGYYRQRVFIGLLSGEFFFRRVFIDLLSWCVRFSGLDIKIFLLRIQTPLFLSSFYRFWSWSLFLSYSYRIPIGFLDMKTVPRFSNIEATRFLRNFWSKKLTDRW